MNLPRLCQSLFAFDRQGLPFAAQICPMVEACVAHRLLIGVLAPESIQRLRGIMQRAQPLLRSYWSRHLIKGGVSPPTLKDRAVLH